MRRAVVALAVSGVVAVQAAGAAPTDRYVLWSAKSAGAPPQAVAVLPADLPDDVGKGAAANLLDRTAGGRVAVAAIDELVLENLDGSGRVVLPIVGAYDGRFSPDGKLLVVASRSCGYVDYRCSDLSLVASDGTRLRVLAHHAGPARWLGSTRLAFVASVGTNTIGTLETETTDGRTTRRLGRSFATPAPAPSPDGQLLVDACGVRVVCVRRTSSPGKVVSRFEGAGLVEAAVWSPDGTRVGLTRAGNYTSTAAVGVARTGVLQPITAPDAIGTDDSFVAWSPDGRTILVQRRCHLTSGCREQVFSEVLSTHARRRLTRDDLEWKAVRWTRTSLTYVTAPTG